MARFQNIVGTPDTPSFVELKTVIPIAQTGGGTYNAINLYHARKIGSGSQPTLINIGTAFQDLVADALSGAMSVQAGAGKIYARWLDSPAFSFEEVGDIPAGVVTGDNLPSLNAVCFQLKSNIRGRSYNGSKHFAAVAESDTTGDKLNTTGAGHWDAVRDSLNVWRTDPVNAGYPWQMCVISQVLSDFSSDPCVFTGADVQSILVNQGIGTMRRRRLRNAPTA